MEEKINLLLLIIIIIIIIIITWREIFVTISAFSASFKS